VDSHEPLKPSKPDQPVRMLKIEEDGDFFRCRTKPKIRLVGRWLERAGFKPGTRVTVTCLAPGVIELRSGAFMVYEGNQAASALHDRPF
jgi:hypothetical protein